MISAPKNRRFSARVRTAVPVLHELFALIEAQDRLTLLDIAEAAGTSSVSLYRWRTGLNAPCVDALAAVAEVLGYELVLRPKQE